MPLGRLIFASISTAVFLTSLLSGLAGGYAVILVLLLAGVIIFQLRRGDVAAREARAVRLRPYFGFFLRTNNRWLLCMAVMTVSSLVMAIRTAPGAPIIRTRIQNEVSEGGQSRQLTEIRQRYYNLYHVGQYKTDAELRNNRLPKWYRLTTGLFNRPEPPRSWTPWWTRWISATILLGLTIGYIPFAFSDEVRRAYVSAERHFAEKAGGEVGGESAFWRFFGRLLRVPAALRTGGTVAPPPTPAPGATPGTTPPTAEAGAATAHLARAVGRGSGLWSVFLVALAAELFGERLFERR